MIKKGFICLCVFLMCLVTPVYGEELKLAPNAGCLLYTSFIAPNKQSFYDCVPFLEEFFNIVTFSKEEDVYKRQEQYYVHYISLMKINVLKN